MQNKTYVLAILSIAAFLSTSPFLVSSLFSAMLTSAHQIQPQQGPLSTCLCTPTVAANHSSVPQFQIWSVMHSLCSGASITFACRQVLMEVVVVIA